MNPFEMPPSGSPVPFEPPFEHPAAEPSAGRHRGRMALVAVVTAGLIGGGIVGVSALASADRPEVDAASAPIASVPDDSTRDNSGPDDTPPDDTPPEDDGGTSETPHVSGTIELDLGEGDPITIDLDELDEDAVRQLTDCIGLPSFDFSVDGPVRPPIPNLDDLFGRFEQFEWPDDLGGLHVIDGGSSVTVTGPDGVSVVDLGENGSVTVTSGDDGISIETTGDATVSELDELFGDLGELFEGEFAGDVGGRLENLPGRDGVPVLERLDGDAIQACVDAAFGG